MKEKSKHSESWTAARALRAIPRRLQLAFPALSALLPMLSIAQRHGRDWRGVADSHCEELSDGRRWALCDELEDLFDCGWNERRLDVVAEVLGLDVAFAQREAAPPTASWRRSKNGSAVSDCRVTRAPM
jgi:hypothetical protein